MTLRPYLLRRSRQLRPLRPLRLLHQHSVHSAARQRPADLLAMARCSSSVLATRPKLE
jgi:hypothetical protein